MSSSSSSAATSRVSLANQMQLVSSNSSPNKLQYKFISNNRIILLNRQSIFNQFISNRHNPNDNFCLYLHRYCLQNRLEGFNYCIRHILQDKNAPFRQCSFVNSHTGKRCPNAARRLDRRDAICPWHIRKRNLDIRRAEMAQEQSDNNNLLTNQTGDSPQETSFKRKLEELEHYCPEEHDHRRKSVDWELPEDRCIAASKSLREKIKESIKQSQSQAQSDDEAAANATLSDVLNLDMIDSDNESAESYMDDPLRHAGVYTAEEVAHILRDKMLRLQTLYINLLNYYRYLLKGKMRDYFVNLKQEKSLKNEPALSSESTPADFSSEQVDRKLLKAMHQYHNVSGSERVIKNVASEIRRSFVDETEPPSSSRFPTCAFIKDSGACNQRCIPLSSYCKAHVLYDPHQILYRPCAGGSPYCLTPVISYVHKNSCLKHVQMKFEKADIDNILKSPTKMIMAENTNETTNTSMNELTNENELFPAMPDEMAMEMDHSGGPSNLFTLENFDLENADILS